MDKRLLIFLAVLGIAAEVLSAGVVYDRTNNCLRVVGFPAEQPATLQILLEADRQNGWGKVSYQPQADTYTVDAAIWVGDRGGNSTFFKIGDRAHSNLTLVLKGSLWVRAAIRGLARSDGSPSIMNSLTIGDPTDPAITPRILFDCTTPGEHGFFGGLRWQSGAAENTCILRMYNATVAALKTNAPQHRWGSSEYHAPGPGNRIHTLGCLVSEFRLENCRFADFLGTLFYGADTAGWSLRERRMLPNAAKTIRNCVFENGGAALSGQQYFSSCVFRNLDQPVADSGTLWVRYHNCTFENNRNNWIMNGYSVRGVTLVDCRVAPQSQPLLMKKNSQPQPGKGVPEYPTARILQTLRVRVMDADGKPVPGAVVTVQGNGPVEHPEALAGVDGWTGADPQTDAIVVAVRQYRASDDPAHPTVTENFQYTINASGQGKSGSKIVCAKELDQPVVVAVR